MRSISIIIPIYNEERNITPLYDALAPALTGLSAEYEREIIFVDDGSTDGSAAALEHLAVRDATVKCIHFSRNFGKEVALTAGLHHAKGDAAIMLDADLQHPPSHIPEFISKWRSGADTVVGVRKESQEGWGKRAGSALFYRIMNAIGSTRITPHATDFRLIDRRMIDEFNRFTERSRMTRGLLDWMGFKRDYVAFVSPPRGDGAPRYGTRQLIRLALSSFVTHSLFPLKFAGYAGLIITMVSGLLGLAVLVEQYLWGDPFGWHFSGSAMLAIFNSFLIGIVLSCLGLIALYVANIHNEVVNRPMYIVRKKTGF